MVSAQPGVGWLRSAWRAWPGRLLAGGRGRSGLTTASTVKEASGGSVKSAWLATVITPGVPAGELEGAWRTGPAGRCAPPVFRPGMAGGLVPGPVVGDGDHLGLRRHRPVVQVVQGDRGRVPGVRPGREARHRQVPARAGPGWRRGRWARCAARPRRRAARLELLVLGDRDPQQLGQVARAVRRVCQPVRVLARRAAAAGTGSAAACCRSMSAGPPDRHRAPSPGGQPAGKRHVDRCSGSAAAGPEPHPDGRRLGQRCLRHQQVAGRVRQGAVDGPGRR